MDKKMIERALYPKIIGPKSRKSWWKRGIARGLAGFLANVFTEEAVVIEAESIYASHLVSRDPYMEIHLDSDSLDIYSESYILLPGHPLPEGKALAIILPLEKEDD